MELFGISIKRIPPAETPSAGVVLPQNDDGATTLAASGSAYYGVYLDVDGAVKNEIQAIQTYREMSSYPEIDLAVQDIVNEAIPHENDSTQTELILDKLEVSDNLKRKIQESFDEVLKRLDYNMMASDIFRRWYVEGRIYYQVIIDKANPELGILELRPIDSTKIKKIREVTKERSESGVDVVKKVDEYYVFSEAGFVAQNASAVSSAGSMQGVRISPDSIIYVPSGLLDSSGTTVQSYLHKAIRPINQLRMMEDSAVVYRMSRAPERRVFYVDVGNLPKGKAEQYLKDIMNNYRNKMVYDSKTGNIRDDKKYMSMLEDFWLPRRDGTKGTEISTLPGAQNLDQIGDIEYFQKKVYEALNIPISRIQPDTGFSLGRTTEVSRDEVKFQKFIDRLRRKFSYLLFESLKTQLILKGICNDLEWEDIKENIRFRFQRDNVFSEMKNLDILQARMAIMPQIDPYLGKYFSKLWVQKNILQLSDEDIARMNAEIKAEAGDKTAQPSFVPSGLGGDPDNPFGSGMPPPQADQDQEDEEPQPQGMPQ